MELKDWILLVAAFASGSITPLIIAYIQRKPKPKSDAETVLDISNAASEIVEGGGKAVEAVTKILSIYEKRNSEQQDEIKSLRLEITNANARITAMQIDEIKRERLDSERNKAIAAKIEALQNYIKVLIDTLRTHDIDIPPRPDILKDSDTLDKIRAVKE